MFHLRDSSLAGAIAGGAAVAAAVILSDKKNQKKVKEAFIGAREKVTEYIDSIKVQPVIEKNSRKLAEVVKLAK